MKLAALLIGAAAIFAGCGGSQPPIGEPGMIPQSRAIARHAGRGGSRMLRQDKTGPFLYVGGLGLSMYALGSSTPLHVATVNPSTVYKAAIALDLHGHLCEANGEISYAQLLEYDANNLKFRRGLTGVGAFPALVADRLGYLYASTGGGDIVVYAPGCTHEVDAIHRGVDVVGPLVFDSSGNLYAGMQPHYAVSVYAPTTRPGHMRFIRKIRDGIDNPVALATGPSGDLFVANVGYGGRGPGDITVYGSGGSKPIQSITSGIEFPSELAVDSQGELYVDNNPGAWGARGRAWISVFAPGSSQPAHKIKAGDLVAIALDASDNLYAANILHHNSVLVYSAGGTKLLQTIKEGIDDPSALLIGSP